MGTINITYNQIRELFSDFADRHYQINSFYFGDVDKIGNSEEYNYPLLAVIPKDVQMLKQNETYNQSQYSFNIICGDLLDEDHSNETEVRSDTLQILQDLIAEFSQARYYNENLMTLETNAVITPFTERFDDLTTGWVLTISIRTPFRGTPCKSPLSDQKSGSDLTQTDCE